tara:strand:+ start:349 stop:465 length:117 start_codon:yes stop_codon:yes gene_type:complete
MALVVGLNQPHLTVKPTLDSLAILADTAGIKLGAIIAL